MADKILMLAFSDGGESKEFAVTIKDWSGDGTCEGLYLKAVRLLMVQLQEHLSLTVFGDPVDPLQGEFPEVGGSVRIDVRRDVDFYRRMLDEVRRNRIAA
jgi:hypothetical protein